MEGEQSIAAKVRDLVVLTCAVSIAYTRLSFR